VETVAAMERVLQQCIDAGAMQGSSKLYFPGDCAPAEDAAIAYMVEQGWAEVSAAGGMTLLSCCLMQCKVKRNFSKPMKVLSHELHLPVLKRSTAALLSWLFADGWDISEVAAGKSMLSNAPAYGPLVAAGSGAVRPLKKMYIKMGNKTIANEYAAAMVLTADVNHVQQLHIHGIHCVEHFMPRKYYQFICQLDFSGLQSLRILTDGSDDPTAAALDARLAASTAGLRKKQVTAKFRLEDSFRWGCVSFKGTRNKHKDGTVKWGLQCDCPRRSHMTLLPSGGRTVCTLSMTYSDGEERELVIRKLKAWVVAAWNHKSRSSHHKSAKQWASALDVPSHDNLEDQKPDEDKPLTDIDDEQLCDASQRNTQTRPAKRRRGPASRPRSEAGPASIPSQPAAAAKRPASNAGSDSSKSSSSSSSRKSSASSASLNTSCKGKESSDSSSS
jgi:hypothetical protein